VTLNKLLDLIRGPVFTEAMTAERMARSDRSTGTREAILSAAELLFAERGMNAVSNRQISEAAGQGNNAAACYHFGTRTELLRAIESKHREPIEELRAQMVGSASVSASSLIVRWPPLRVSSRQDSVRVRLRVPIRFIRRASRDVRTSSIAATSSRSLGRLDVEADGEGTTSLYIRGYISASCKLPAMTREFARRERPRVIRATA
jgi:AcrR family transcriptional regulator